MKKTTQVILFTLGFIVLIGLGMFLERASQKPEAFPSKIRPEINLNINLLAIDFEGSNKSFIEKNIKKGHLFFIIRVQPQGDKHVISLLHSIKNLKQLDSNQDGRIDLSDRSFYQLHLARYFEKSRAIHYHAFSTSGIASILINLEDEAQAVLERLEPKKIKAINLNIYSPKKIELKKIIDLNSPN